MKSPTHRTKYFKLTLSVCFIYCLIWLSYYSQIAIGQYPNPDQTTLLQNVALGNATTLYEGLLSIISKFTETEKTLIKIAHGVQVTALILSALICAIAAGNFWKSHRAGCIAALLIGINPVAVFCIGQITPALLALLCVAIFFWRIMKWIQRSEMIDSFVIGASLTIGVLLEPSLVLLALAWPLVAFLYPTKNKAIHFILGIIIPAAVAALITVSNLQVPGSVAHDGSNILSQVYNFFSNKEVDDGMSYSIQHKLHLLLLLNPIHWGLLFILAVGGIYCRIKDGYRGLSVLTLLITLALFTAGYVVVDGGGQARLTITPLLAIFGAGCISVLPRIWKHAGGNTKRKVIVGTAILATLTYSGHFLEELDTAKLEKNYAYMARANVELNKNEMATIWAEKALELNPERKDMYTVLVRAKFNNWATILNPRSLSIEQVKDQLDVIKLAEAINPQVASIKAYYLWKLKERDAAVELWKANSEAAALAQIGILWTQNEETWRRYEAPVEHDPYFDLLLLASSINRSDMRYSDEEKIIDNLFSEAH